MGFSQTFESIWRIPGWKKDDAGIIPDLGTWEYIRSSGSLRSSAVLPCFLTSLRGILASWTRKKLRVRPALFPLGSLSRTVRNQGRSSGCKGSVLKLAQKGLSDRSRVPQRGANVIVCVDTTPGYVNAMCEPCPRVAYERFVAINQALEQDPWGASELLEDGLKGLERRPLPTGRTLEEIDTLQTAFSDLARLAQAVPYRRVARIESTKCRRT